MLQLTLNRFAYISNSRFKGAPSPEYTIYGGYISSAAGSSARKANLVLDYLLHTLTKKWPFYRQGPMKIGQMSS